MAIYLAFPAHIPRKPLASNAGRKKS